MELEIKLYLEIIMRFSANRNMNAINVSEVDITFIEGK